MIDLRAAQEEYEMFDAGTEEGSVVKACMQFDQVCFSMDRSTLEA